MPNGRLLLLTFLFFLLFWSAPKATAQLCPGSQVNLIVRDEKGAVMDPTPLSERRRLSRTFDFVKVQEAELPNGIGDGRGSTKVLLFSDDGCTLRPAEEATFEFQGRKMRLVFRNPKRERDRSVFYTIDLPPFRQGTFEIDLSSPVGLVPDSSGQTSFEESRSFVFSSGAWRETGSAAPDMAETHDITFRGTVMHSLTGLPLGGVKVELLLGVLGEEVYAVSGTTDANGRFEITGVPDEQLIKSDRVSVRASAENYAATQVIILNHRQLAQTRKEFDNISMRLRPLVTITGRLVDVKSGQAAKITPGTLRAYALADASATVGDYLTKIHSTAEAEISADGSFTMVVPAGKISFSIANYQEYQTVAPGTRQVLLDESLNVDVKADNQPEIVFRTRNAGS